MRIPSGKVDQLIFFVALDATDLKTRKTGLTTFTVYRSRNGGTPTVYTTPTVAELSASNMPGVYSLTIDEDTTVASTSDSEEYCVHITQASMAPVTRTIEIYRRDTTSGNTALVDSNGRVDVIKIAGTTQTARDIGASVLLSAGTGTGQLDFTSGVVKANATQFAGQTISAAAGVTMPSSVASPTNITAGTITTVTNLTNAATAGDLTATMKASVTTAATAATPTAAAVTGAVGSVTGAVGSVTGLTASDVGAIKTTIGVAGAGLTALGDARIAHLDADVSTRLATSGYTAPDNTSISAIKAKTDNLPSDPADESLIIAATNSLAALIGTPAGASVSADVAAVKGDTSGIRSVTDTLVLTGGKLWVLDENGNALPHADGIADAVWEEALADHSGTSGSTAAALAAAGSSGDPWSTLLPGSYTSGQAGKIVGDALDAKLSDITGKTDGLSFTVSGQIDANIQYVNDVQVSGNGSDGTPWGPA